jgi:hypothetical protein
MAFVDSSHHIITLSTHNYADIRIRDCHRILHRVYSLAICLENELMIQCIPALMTHIPRKNFLSKQWFNRDFLMIRRGVIYRTAISLTAVMKNRGEYACNHGFRCRGYWWFDIPRWFCVIYNWNVMERVRLEKMLRRIMFNIFLKMSDLLCLCKVNLEQWIFYKFTAQPLKGQPTGNFCKVQIDLVILSRPWWFGRPIKKPQFSSVI